MGHHAHPGVDAMRSSIISAAMAAVVLASADCTITTRSENYACTTNEDCDELGRVCVRGWCVVDDVQPPDASLPTCPMVCNDCLPDGTCIIQCINSGDCSNDVVCPPGRPCEVICGTLACQANIDCTAASSCDITCSGISSCSGNVSCGTGSCYVTCSGVDSCDGVVSCQDSCACQTLCTGLASCNGEHRCPNDDACENGGTCTASPDICNRC
jgi:hypothetical protein